LRIENFKRVYLSYILDSKTPTYGNRNRFEQIKKSDISKGDVANDTSISTTVHIGTHIDMPYHFYENGQTIEDFDADFWVFQQDEILFIELRIENGELIIRDELIMELEKIKNNSQFSTLNSQLLIVKTGICHKRESQEFWAKNYGFHPDIYNYLVDNFPNIRVIGFDSISVSSLTDRMLGREAHKRFLNPNRPILLLEDMDLRKLNSHSTIKELIISPLQIAKCDGLPCTILCRIEN
jgi:kynurenine formamidase